MEPPLELEEVRTEKCAKNSQRGAFVGNEGYHVPGLHGDVF